MKKQMEKYATVLLKTCLKIEKGQPLFISANIERLDFVRIVAEVAYKLGVKDIYYDLSDPHLKHIALQNLDIEDLKKMTFWNKEKWNEYAKKGAAFLMLASETPGLMKDIDCNVINELTLYSFKTRKDFDDLRKKSMVPWCIAAVPTEIWAKKIFPKEQDPVKKLWKTIFKICGINEEPENIWKNKINSLSNRAKKLNECNFKKLKYQNELGTDLEIELPKNHIWASGQETLANGKKILANFPTEEVFTSPKYDSVNGIVYSSKPLCYQDSIIEDFNITFENGKVIKCKAKKGEKILQQMISSFKNFDYLGEVALVEYDSAISQSNLIFYETLYDENAACHLALGSSFPECIKNGTKMSKKELQSAGLNNCENHVDFMIGTKDLKIIGTTYDDKEITIFENGNFTKRFQ